MFLAPYIPAIVGVSAVAGAGVSAYSAVQQGKASRKAAEYNAAVGNQNAILAQQQAQQQNAILQNQAQWQQYQQGVAENQATGKVVEAEALRTSTEENLKRRREDYRRILSRQKAQFAKGGVAMTGTPIEVLAESATRMELEAQDVVNQTRSAIEAMYYESELIRAGAQSIGADVYMTQYQGRNALLTGTYKANVERSQGQAGIAAGKSAQTASYYQAGGSLLSGVSGAYTDYRTLSPKKTKAVA